MDKYQSAVLDLLADSIREQQKTQQAIVELTEALSGVRREVADDAGKPPEGPEAAIEQPEPPKEEKPVPGPAPELDRSQATPEDRTAYLGELRKVFAAKSKEGKKDELKQLLQSFDATKLPEVNEENWPELKARAENL